MDDGGSVILQPEAVETELFHPAGQCMGQDAVACGAPLPFPLGLTSNEKMEGLLGQHENLQEGTWHWRLVIRK